MLGWMIDGEGLPSQYFTYEHRESTRRTYELRERAFQNMGYTMGACVVCGCSLLEVEVYGDRVCFCDSCQKMGCTGYETRRGLRDFREHDLQKIGYNKSPCAVCGCSSDVDMYGDRVCFCDSCQKTGCNTGYRTRRALRDYRTRRTLRDIHNTYFSVRTPLPIDSTFYLWFQTVFPFF